MNFYTNVWTDGNTVYDRYFDDDGKDKVRKSKFSPTLYRHVGDHIETNLVDIYGRKCAPKKHENIGTARRWMKEMNSMSIDVLGMDNFTFQYISDTYGSNVHYNYSMLDIGFLDIEVPTDGPFPDAVKHEYEIDTIQFYSTKSKKYFIWSTRPWNKDDSELDSKTTDDVIFHHAVSEKEILVRFIQYFVENTPHYVSGWNSEQFDIPYVMGRIIKVLGETYLNKLSPFGEVTSIMNKNDNDEEYTTYDIRGVNCIDFMAAYKKFTFTTRPNYKLDTIAEAELGINKIVMPFKTYLDFATKAPQKYIDYSIRDVEIIKRLEERLSLIYLIASVSYYAAINPNDVFSPLKTWDAIIYNSLLAKGVIIPENKHSQRSKFAGAYVKDPVPGLYKWLLSFDLTSLYPHIIMGTNISPETLVDQLDVPRILVKDRMVPDVDGMGLVDKTYTVPHEGKYSFAANGVRYRTDVRGFLPIEVEKVFIQRKEAKTEEFKADRQATTAARIIANRADNGGVVTSDIKRIDFDVNYPIEKLESMSDEQLKNYISDCRHYEKVSSVAQQAKKVLINSLYGSLGHPVGRYYDLRMAESITIGGQLAIKWISRKTNEFFDRLCGTDGYQYVVYCDTDSQYVCVENLVELMAKKKGINSDDLEPVKWVDFLDNFAKTKVEPYIDKCYVELKDYMNYYDHKLFMDREVIATKGFWTAKKRYALSVWDNEGKRKLDSHGNVVPKLKIMGIETRRSTTPPFASECLEKSIDIILETGSTERNLQDYVEKAKEDYRTQDYRLIAQVSSANNIEKNHDKFQPVSGCPGHIKAAINYNRICAQLKENNIHVNPIRTGEKIQFVTLKVPNKYHAETLAWPSGDVIPEAFGLNPSKDIDYSEMYCKHFQKPLETICSAIGWKQERILSLDDLFDM